MTSDSDNVISLWDRSDPNADINEMKNFVEEERRETARYCPHTNILVSEYERSISCRLCGAALDTFDYVLSIAKRETRLDWDLRHLRSEIKRRTESLENLKREEVNTRARIKTAQFKLHDVSLALEEAGEKLLKVKNHGKRGS
ncbi:MULTISPECIES: hypothetical protein [Pantoea]|uniref:hypothetical protein n=1 Tax=Pantoea TaxID=53335 RepID=UPI0019669638|nr:MULTISPECIES: hypothetical protein [Pantoea]